jgi:hypothetical protein
LTERFAGLEAIVAHGARMSWAGILRPGDEFPRAKISRLAVMTSTSGSPLTRRFGSWSARYGRFTSNLSSPAIRVEVGETGRSPSRGIQCFVHWVDREAMLGTGPGTVCSGDGWPVELWSAFVAAADRLPRGSVADQLASYAFDGEWDDRIPAVRDWRASLRSGAPKESPSKAVTFASWIPVPAELISESGMSHCTVSWSPSTLRFASLDEAVSSKLALKLGLNLQGQTAYYLECVMATLHGVQFGSDDLIVSEAFEDRPEVKALRGSYLRLERTRIADPRLGRLDRFG